MKIKLLFNWISYSILLFLALFTISCTEDISNTESLDLSKAALSTTAYYAKGGTLAKVGPNGPGDSELGDPCQCYMSLTNVVNQSGTPGSTWTLADITNTNASNSSFVFNSNIYPATGYVDPNGVSSTTYPTAFFELDPPSDGCHTFEFSESGSFNIFFTAEVHCFAGGNNSNTPNRVFNFSFNALTDSNNGIIEECFQCEEDTGGVGRD